MMKYRQEYRYLKNIFLLIRTKTGHDFSNYKINTTGRRIERRMAVHQITRISEYYKYLQQNPAEVETLYKEMLIGVTNYFRNPEAFEVIQKKVIPGLLKKKKADEPLRIWVPGCSTGEEAYSLAIAFMEAMGILKKRVNVQIFATDIDADAIEFARAAVYPVSIAADVKPIRLKRFFTKVNEHYVAKREIREMLVFAVQNIVKDPPFSKLDLVSCRNLLIYVNQTLQKKILSLFHYTLNQNGILFLGSSESIGGFADLFIPLNSKWKIYRRIGSAVDRVMEYTPLPIQDITIEPENAAFGNRLGDVDIRRIAEKAILDNLSPPCVLINKKYEIMYFHGDTSNYLAPPYGEASFNILKMARDDLRYKLSTAIHKAIKNDKTVIEEGIQLFSDERVLTIDLEVRRISKDNKAVDGLFMVVFEEKDASQKVLRKKGNYAGKKAVDSRLASLEQELKATKEYLQTTNEELETTNEELKSSNEELQSTNEEMQSANEELETSKEELQSTNEELATVNAELQSKVEDLSQANDDLNNLMASTEIETIFLDTELCIKRFTPTDTEIFNLKKGDIGRPISDITFNMDYDSLYKDAKNTLETLEKKEIELRTLKNSWVTMRILPYRTLDNVIDGVVITFVDVTKLKRIEKQIQNAREYAEGIIRTVREPLVILDDELNVLSANNSFFKTFKMSPRDTNGKYIFDLGNRQWDIPELRKLLEEILPKDSAFDDFKVENEFPKIGNKTMLLSARRMINEEGEKENQLILLAFEDVTDRAGKEERNSGR